VPGEKAQAKGWRLWLEEEMGWQLPEGLLAG
jgi:DNA helicase-4